MLNLFLMVREINNLTNDPLLLIRLYRDQKDKAKYGLIWAKGDQDAENVIKQFFKPERFLKRLKILYDYRNRLGSVKHLSLFGFYLQLAKRYKQLTLIYWKPIKRNRQDLNKTQNDSI